MYRSGNAKLSKDEITDLNFIENKLKVINPEWTAFTKHSYGYGKPPEKYISFCVKQKDGSISIPRNFPLNNCAEISKVIDKTFYPKELCAFKSKGVLRDYQKDYVNKIIEDNYDDYIIQMPCGHGKTLVALWLMAFYQKTTIVLVPTKFLAEQWASRIETFLTGASVNIYNTKTDINKELISNNYNIHIINLTLLSRREISEEAKKKIGVTVLDEGHRIGAPTYQPFLEMLPTKRRIVLTATLRRSDGMHEILRYHFGKSYVIDNQFAPATIIPVLTGITIPKEKYYSRGKPQFSLLDTMLAEHSTRSKIMLTIMFTLLQRGRSIIFLSKRRKVLELYHAEALRRGYKSALVVGKKKGKDEVKGCSIHDAKIVFGIMQLAQEGLDIEHLDTLIFNHPIKDVEQPIGRILRDYEHKKNPVVIFPVDENSECKAIFQASKNYVGTSGEYKRVQTLHELLSVMQNTKEK